MNITLILLCFLNFSWSKPSIVNVGGYEFPPFVMNTTDGGYDGLTLDLISLLNQKQTKYEFRFVPTSTSRRYNDLEEGRYHIIAYESKSWGWNPNLVGSTKIFHHGGEVFVTLKSRKKSQSYFKNLKNKKIRGIRGYHYGFLGLSTGAKAMKEFDLELTNTHVGNILSVLNGRADIAVVSKEFLDLYLNKNPDTAKKLLISKDFDQIYELGILVSKKQTVITLDEMNKLIEEIQKDGSLHAVLKEKGIQK